jgi:hypothetical protein
MAASDTKLGGASRDSADGRVRPNARLGILRMRTSRSQAEHFVACWSVSPRIGWAVRNGLWVFDTQNNAELLRAAITCTYDGALARAHPVISD